jgi:hypothetical protein
MLQDWNVAVAGHNKACWWTVYEIKEGRKADTIATFKRKRDANRFMREKERR